MRRELPEAQAAPAEPGTPEWDEECAEFGCHGIFEDDDFWMLGPDAHRWTPGDGG